jgi:hypothetical protein
MLRSAEVSVCESWAQAYVMLMLRLQYLEAWLQERPDSTLTELRTHLFDVFGTTPHLSTISRELARSGYTRKKVCSPI